VGPVIHYLAIEEHGYTMDILVSAEPALAGRVLVLPYERAAEKAALAPGVYIFSDLDRLSDAELQPAIELWRRLSELGPEVRLLNDPTRVLRRYELLRMLYAEGINRFNVFRIPPSLPSDPPMELRFPVFVREERERQGPLSDLLYSWRDVREAVGKLVAGGEYSPEELLIVEWCDTADAAGVFRRYRALVIGGTIVARELVCSREWLVNQGYALVDAEHLREARAYVAENPHASFLQDVARRANVDYGRFDYALLDGRPQVWEIELNPLVIAPPPGQSEVPVERLSFELFRVPMRRIAAALEALDHAPQRQSFEDRLQHQLDAASAKRPLGLCMLDVDDFRRVTDTHGHVVGERLLLEVAGCLRRCGETFRVGPDEFALLLPGRHEPRALTAAEAALERVHALDFGTGEPIRVSAGLALYPTHCSDRSELVRAASDALAEAKREGKIRVHLFRPPPSTP
jgi:diguanylate cyclase (GGDEF)-like protein